MVPLIARWWQDCWIGYSAKSDSSEQDPLPMQVLVWMPHWKHLQAGLKRWLPAAADYRLTGPVRPLNLLPNSH